VREHLSQEDIQSYLDGQASDLEEPIRAHLRACKHCRRAVEEYDRLYAALADTEGFHIPPNLEETVSLKLGLRSPIQRSSYGDALIAAAGIVAAIALTLYLTDIRSVLGILGNGPPQFAQYASDLVAALRGTADALGPNAAILAAAGVVLVIVGLLDHLLPGVRPAVRRP
jgi:anti-sigma factor RsiW